MNLNSNVTDAIKKITEKFLREETLRVVPTITISVLTFTPLLQAFFGPTEALNASVSFDSTNQSHRAKRNSFHLERIRTRAGETNREHIRKDASWLGKQTHFY